MSSSCPDQNAPGPRNPSAETPMDVYMLAAISEAQKGLAEGGIPIGSVLVKNGFIIGRGRNKRVQENNPVMHAETDCLRNAGRIGSYRGTVLYTTLMPCYFCAGAAVQFGIKKIIAGESQSFRGARAFLESHHIEVIDLNLSICKHLMAQFVMSSPQLWYEDIGSL